MTRYYCGYDLLTDAWYIEPIFNDKWIKTHYDSELLVTCVEAKSYQDAITKAGELFAEKYPQIYPI